MTGIGLGVLLATAVLAGQVTGEYLSFSRDMKAALGWNWFTRDFRDLTFLRMPGLSPDYQLGIGDAIQISIVGMDDSPTYRIRATGDVVIPLLGPVPVAGLTAEEAELAIAAKLRSSQLIRDPEVLIYVASYEAKRFWVYGQVDRPGEYTMSQPLTVMDAIFMAGGLDFYGDRYAYLHRRLPSPRAMAQRLVERPDETVAGSQIIRIDLQSMRDGGVLPDNPIIEGGDALVIPTRYPTVFYVLGDVVQPGAFQINSGERLTVSQAVSHAGGPGRTAQSRNGIVIRYDLDGIRQDLPVDYDAIIRGLEPDFEILSNDVLFFPGDASKMVGYGVLDLLPSALAALTFVR
jgi:polysaccharide export outer membrane protein